MRRFFVRVWLTTVGLLFGTVVALNVYYLTAWDMDGYEDPGAFYVGGYELAAETFASGATSESDLAARFGFDVARVDRERIPETARRLLDSGLRGVAFRDGGEYFVVPIPDSPDLLRFGPWPEYDWTADVPADATIALAFALVSAVVLGALIRPVARELGELESSARQIARGDWNGRADETNARTTAALARAFNQMAETTSSVIGAQRELLRAVSHELRTPLARLHTGIHVAAGIDDRDERLTRVGRLDRSFEQLAALVDELLTYARFDAGGSPESDHPPMAVGAELRVLVAQHGDGAEARGVEVAVLESDDAPELAADPRLFRRAVGNLLSNAVRYAESSVELRVVERDGELRLSVDDDGPGVEEHDRERLLRPFVRQPRFRGDDGYGMGLAIADRIVASHGGRLVLGRASIGGCRAELRWPTAPRPEPSR